MCAHADRPPPETAGLGLITGYWVSQLVFVAARLGIADELARGPRTPEAIAERVGAQAPILRHCREAMAPGGRVLVAENVIPPGNRPNWGKLLDINMLVVTGGKERTREEFRDLLARAGLRLRRVVPTASPLSLLEAAAK